MDKPKLKEGVSVREIEDFTKKHRFEVFFCLAFILACLFSFVIWSPGWSVIAAAIGAIIGILLESKIGQFSNSTFRFILKQEKMTQLVLGIVFLILAIFICPLYFLLLGLHGGKDLQRCAREIDSSKS